VPARYGGFETFAEELALRLVARGHAVTVYSREGYVSRKRRSHRGIEVVVLPRIRSKHLETIAHALSSALASRARSHDVVLLCNAACAPLVPLFKAPVVVNVDGVERLRRKWGALGRLWYRAAEKLALGLASRCVADARAIADYYRERHGARLPVIAYGADPARRVAPGPVLERLGLEPDGYFLVVTRLEPENHASLVAEAFRSVETRKKLVVVGDAPYAPGEKRALLRARARDPRLVLPGAIYGRRVRELFTNAFAYVQATEVGGTHPALLEGMALAPCVIANAVPEHEEVIADGGIYYAKNDASALAAALSSLLASPHGRDALGARAREIVRERYSWDKVADAYLALFREVMP
jgi:glycosyltransferase involved in cell wall biosynthesis